MHRLIMPIDLSPAGFPSAYPARPPRFWPWSVSWLLCWGLGVAIVLLLWPVGKPAAGIPFWLYVIGLPNAIFFVALAIARAIYEADYLHAIFRNRHRLAWIRARIRTAQRPLQVLGAGYCLPLHDKPLPDVLAANVSLLEARVPRKGVGRVVHNRFADDDPAIVEFPVDGSMIDPISPADEADFPPCGPPEVHVIGNAIAPLAESLAALSQYGVKYAPAVRVISAPEMADARVGQVKLALEHVGLPALECVAMPAAESLMIADAWLDAVEQRPLLVVAVEWHDAPPVGSTEGAVAVLLAPGMFRLPEPIYAQGLLHRPVADEVEDLEAVVANGVLWGNAQPANVEVAWISGLDSSNETRLLAALRGAGLVRTAEQSAQRRLDTLIGHAGTAGGWLSVAAALEASAGTHLILHAPAASTAQAAILHTPARTNTALMNDRSQ